MSLGKPFQYAEREGSGTRSPAREGHTYGGRVIAAGARCHGLQSRPHHIAGDGNVYRRVLQRDGATAKHTARASAQKVEKPHDTPRPWRDASLRSDSAL